MELEVCVGSSCHLKGSQDVIAELQNILKKYEVEDVVTLKASFCLGRCAQGVTVRSDDKLITGFTPENAEDKFLTEIYPFVTF